jgi:putative hemolysin
LGKAQAQEFAEEEIKMLVQRGTRAGVFEASEQDMVEAVFRLADKTARALMTPRTQVVWLNTQEAHEHTSRKLIGSGYSRFPVSDGDLDKVVGVAEAKDLLANALTGKPINLNEALKQPAFVPRSTPALQVLEVFKQSGTHIALVVDEYGGIEGLLTHHDILEAIAGDMPRENSAQPKAEQRQDGSWLLDGMLSIEEFKEIFHLETLPGERRDAYQTLGGFIFTQMGRVPAAAEEFEWNDLRFKVIAMDGKRIDKVLITTLKRASHERVQTV